MSNFLGRKMKRTFRDKKIPSGLTEGFQVQCSKYLSSLVIYISDGQIYLIQPEMLDREN